MFDELNEIVISKKKIVLLKTWPLIGRMLVSLTKNLAPTHILVLGIHAMCVAIQLQQWPTSKCTKELSTKESGFIKL